MNWRFRITPVLAVGLLLTSSVIAQDKGTKGKTTENYYPLELGNEWTYKITVGENSAVAVSTISKIETIEKLALSKLEVKVNGEVKATEHLIQTPDGVFRHRNNGIDIEPPVCLIKYPAKPGAKWSGELKVDKETGKYTCETAEEMVAVPAGKFKALRVTIKLEAKDQKVTTAYWFVKEMGFVKQTVEAGTPEMPLRIIMELEKFERGKAAPKKDKSSTK